MATALSKTRDPENRSARQAAHLRRVNSGQARRRFVRSTNRRVRDPTTGPVSIQAAQIQRVTVQIQMNEFARRTAGRSVVADRRRK